MASSPSDSERPHRTFKRRLRAAFSADVANFSGNMSVSETRAFGNLNGILKIGREELEYHEGVLIGVPGDGLFGLFESVVNAVQCAIITQGRLAADPNLGGAMRLRIGIHLGDVLFDGDMPLGETLNIAARLQALADPGGTLVSGAVVDAVSAHVAATFEARGVPQLKNIPRRIATYAVHPRVDTRTRPNEAPDSESLDRTMQLPRRTATGVAGSANAAPFIPPAEHHQANSVAGKESEPMPPSDMPGALPPRPEAAPVHATEKRDGEASPPLPEARSVEHLPARAHLSALDYPPTEETIAIFGDAIAVHLGPVGRVMTARKAKSCSTLADLLAVLEKEIPTPVEQHVFRSRIKRQFEP